MRAWLAKPENQNYFRDDQNAERARDWQKEHPGYWKNTARYRRRTLQDGCHEQAPAAHKYAQNRSRPYLTRPSVRCKFTLFVGLYLHVRRRCTYQDDIATRSTRRRLVSKGHDILGMVPGMNLERLLHEKTCPQSRATPESPAPVQLDRSPAGAGKLLPPV